MALLEYRFTGLTDTRAIAIITKKSDWSAPPFVVAIKAAAKGVLGEFFVSGEYMTCHLQSFSRTGVLVMAPVHTLAVSAAVRKYFALAALSTGRPAAYKAGVGTFFIGVSSAHIEVSMYIYVYWEKNT